MDKLTMGDRIREARKKLGFTQDQLSEKLDVTLTYISEIERGLKMPSMQLFIKLVEILDVSADYLLRDTVSTRNLYGDKQIGRKLERLTPKQRVALEALIDTYPTFFILPEKRFYYFSRPSVV
jgi:transcriptional regulator with XRE-family HTH domain